MPINDTLKMVTSVTKHRYFPNMIWEVSRSFLFCQELPGWVGASRVCSSKLPPSESSSFPNQRNEFRSFRSSDYVMWPVCGPRAASIRGEAYSSSHQDCPLGTAHLQKPKNHFPTCSEQYACLLVMGMVRSWLLSDTKLDSAFGDDFLLIWPSFWHNPSLTTADLLGKNWSVDGRRSKVLSILMKIHMVFIWHL